MGRKAKLKAKRRRARVPEDKLQAFVDPEHLYDLRASILESGARRDSCILSTRIVGLAAERWGIPFEPLTVELGVFNPVIGRWMVEHDRYHPSEIPEAVLEGLGLQGGRFLIVGDRTPNPGPGRWPGHLVAIVGQSQDRWAIDLAIDQAHRPEKDILIEGPVSFPAPKLFVQGHRHAVGSFDDGLVFVYFAHPEDHTYNVTTDWTRSMDIDFGPIPYRRKREGK